jgi:dimethyl sulfoxide reductase iron-sulfur subunit
VAIEQKPKPTLKALRQIPEISRRQMLLALGALGIGVGIGSRILDAAAATAATQNPGVGPQWTMVLDLRLCDGCGTCTTSCQDKHYLPKTTEWIKVYSSIGMDGQKKFLPILCQMCEDPPCQAVCPVGATFRNDQGLVLIDQQVCIGCKTCMAACPFEVRYFNEGPMPATPANLHATPANPTPQQMGTVGKCVWCAEGLTKGELPACVSGCTMGVIYVGDLTTDVAVNGNGDVIRISQFLSDNDAVRLKEELGTNPRVYYVLGHGQDYKGL